MLFSMFVRREEDDYNNFDSSFNTELRIESWTWFAIGSVLTLLRLYATATRSGGPKHWLLDEYLIIMAYAWYTTLIVTLNVIAVNGGSNLFPPDQLSTFTDQDILDRIHNSKIVVVSEQAMLNTIYALKACLLVMYLRLTSGLRTHKWTKILCVYALLGWIGTQICFFTNCIPFNQYWAIPPENDQCATLEYYGVVQGTFNISSDVLMLGIPIYIVVQLQVPWRKKLVMGFVLTMGVFVIAAAVACKIHNLTNTYSSYYMLWYTREASVALYVANMPLIWPLLREWFPWLNRFGPSKQGTYGNPSYGVSVPTGTLSTTAKNRKSVAKTLTTAHNATTSPNGSNESGSESTEEISLEQMIGKPAVSNRTQSENTEGRDSEEMDPAAVQPRDLTLSGGITVETSVWVEESDRPAEEKNSHGEVNFDFEFERRKESK